MAELGFESANRDSLFGLFAPAHTPTAEVQRLHAAINTVLEDAMLRQRLREAYNIPFTGNSEDFAREIALDGRRNRAMLAQGRSQFD